MEQRLLVVGGGRMGTALVKGLGSAGWALTDITVAEVDSTRRDALARKLPGVTVVAEPVPAAGAVVAVKPAAAAAACAVLAESAVPRVAVVRAMPNTPALVGAGISAVAAGSNAGEADLAWAEEVLGSVGAVVRVDEAALDAVTGVSGSGPAYVFLVAEALAQAGEAAGLEAGISRRLAVATVAGAGRLLAEPGSEPEDLRAQVTSPGGTTQAALAVLEEGELRDLRS